ncbi:MAG: hypothetical protein EXS05_24420 [Planctomycetaceae bacterium]|nr:hypothetical protein [Planctomycetaceae bacterium]
MLSKSERSAPSKIATLADLLERLGDVPLERIRFRPAPGTATEEFLESAPDEEFRLAELVEGTLVEKPPGIFESRLAVVLVPHLGNGVS